MLWFLWRAVTPDGQVLWQLQSSPAFGEKAVTQGPGRLLGKSAVITGAAFGIGRATAELFAREGARLVVTDIQGEPLLALADELRRAGAEVETVVGDVSVEATRGG